MEYFYDGACPKEFSEIISKGCIKGITTNVNFVVDYAKSQNIDNYFSAIKPLYDIAKETKLNLPFSIQAVGDNPNDLISSSLRIRDHFTDHINLYIKIPVNYSNLEVINKLTFEEKINVNATCITSFLQATMAHSAGGKILSYFWGKMSDEGIDPCEHVTSLKQYLNTNNSKAKILCGSIRQSRVIHEAFMSGADILTLPFPYFNKLSNRKKSDEATDIFDNTWNMSGMKIN